MKKHIAIVYLLFLFILFSPVYNILNAQQSFFYYQDKKVPLEISQNEIVVKFKPSFTNDQIKNFLKLNSSVDKFEIHSLSHSRVFVKTILKNNTNLLSLSNKLIDNTNVEFISKIFKQGNSDFIPSDNFLVKFKSSVTPEQINSICKTHNVKIVKESKYVKNLYTFKITPQSDLDILAMANLFYESIPSDWATPDFLVKIHLNNIPNDPYFQNQYYLQDNTYHHDINVVNAWDISKGSSTVKVAVIDYGGLEPHEDLPASRILPGYNFADDNNDLTPNSNEAHEMAVAGIIAATLNNGVGISGIAPGVKIIPIKISEENTESELADAINWAVEVGHADIINNSWGFNNNQASPDTYPDITQAIDDAFTYGRNGNGTIVVCAAGNTADRNQSFPEYGFIEYPAMLPGAIAVGAIQRNGDIQVYSPRSGNYNPITVVALSGLPATPYGGNIIYNNGDVWSLDIPGQQGWNPGNYEIDPPNNFIQYFSSNPPSGDSYPPGNYTANFGGTSASCPQVTGLCALILSINSSLTYGDIKNILGQSSDRFWIPDQDYGHGCIDAYNALKYTIENYGATITQDALLPVDTYNISSNVVVAYGATLTI